MRPFSVPKFVFDVMDFHHSSKEARTVYIHQHYLYKKIGDPEVTIMIPAFNEEASILFTLQSLCNTKTKRIIEIIVVNNNSTDNTEALVKACGVRYINETVQGITAARNAGLGAARGKYILNADADVLYPPEWIDEMVKPLEQNKDVCVTYGRFSFLPSNNSGRLSYFIYENIADFSRFLNRKFKDEAVNVYGFDFAFRREQALAVDWFNHPKDAHEDGWMALKLRDKSFGKLYRVKTPESMVWTSDRRLQSDGGLWNGFKKRIVRVLTNSQEQHPGLRV